MNQLDVYYRALLNYRKYTTQSNECNSLRGAIAEADTENDKIVIKRALCTIDEEWVNVIEDGLRHVEKAIKQERQFIRSNGEVVEIEKVKHVSKESVEHLSRHSNLISRYTEGEDIIPDKLYSVERLNDYTVYENRFLYMLLCYLRDFITLRYNDILDLTNKYDAQIELNKNVVCGKRSMTYTLSMHDVVRDDKYLKDHNPARDIINRIDLILKAVFAFLSTPLMEDVSKAPMLKPPITKTNVLKMDNDFKGAVALYSYIIAYDKPGYTVEYRSDSLAPFKDDLADELAEAGSLISFLAYEYGLGIKPDLKESYAKEEDRLKAEEIRKRAERVSALKRKLASSDSSLDEYIAELEKHCRDFDSEVSRAAQLTEQIYQCKEEKKLIIEENEALREEKAAIAEEMESLKHQHFEEIRALKLEHEDAMHALIIKQEEEMNELTAKHREEIQAIKEAEKAERARKEEALAQLRADYESRLGGITADRDALRASYGAALRDCEAIASQRDLAFARVKALYGIDREYTDRETFGDLEREYLALKRIYDDQWKKTKKKIVKKHINKDNLKSNKRKDNESD